MIFPRSAPTLLGIVNITEDSFSDGGRYLAADKAIEHARRLFAEGADVIDLGPAPSNPDAKPVGAAEEMRRIGPVIEALHGDGIPVSLDSFERETQLFALSRGVTWLNDIWGFPDESLYPALAGAACKLIVMHSIQGQALADRRDAPEGDMVARICRFFEARLAALEQAGVARERVILDPGMGFFLGRDPAVSFGVLARTQEIRDRFGLPVLISVSRKSFLRAITGRAPAETGPATLAAELLAVVHGAELIRTHEPGQLRDALAVLAAVKESAIKI
ncbi:MAG: dihydropteroate synthase [Parvibaculaceae bacterium]|nr:dihydropteroate synthase [Parvibaculaceae bacterium]